MANSVYIGMSAALASQRRLDIVANNISNANTVGFKQQRPTFDQFLVATLDGSTPQKGFTEIRSSEIDMRSGGLEKTGNPLDVAIEGDGFFVVDSPTGPLLSRAGNFTMTTDGRMLDGSGYPVMSGTAPTGLRPITIRPDAGPVSVRSDGSIEQGGTVLAQISIVTADAKTLSSAGGTHFRPSDPLAFTNHSNPTVVSGHLESSNVNPVRGMVDLIEVGRDFQTAQKLMNETRKLDERVMNSVR